MTSTHEPDFLINAYLAEGVDELPERSYDAVRAAIDETRQWAVLGPWKEPQIMTATRFAVIAAAIAVLAVVAIRFLPTTNIGPQPTPSATPAATPSPTPSSTSSPSATPTAAPGAVADPSGQLEPATYEFHPFPAPNDAMTFRVTMPSDKWEALGDPGQTSGVTKYGNSGGLGMGFLRITGLEADPCKWKDAKGDIPVGPSVDDLVTALQGVDAYDTSAPTEVTLGGYSGKEVVVTMPATLNSEANLQPGCDDLIWQLFVGEGFNIYAQGPTNEWTMTSSMSMVSVSSS